MKSLEKPLARPFWLRPNLCKDHEEHQKGRRYRKGCSHITGGGFYENVPRMLPEGAHAVIEKSSYEVPAIFRMLQKEGDIEEHMMYNTFNMGIGLVLAIDPKDVDTVLEAVKAAGETPYVIGHIEAGENGVTVC